MDSASQLDVNSERVARTHLGRLLNNLVVRDKKKKNGKQSTTSTITTHVTELLLEYPRLTLEYFRHHRTGEELTILEFFLQSSSVSDATIEEFCRVFPKLLTIEGNKEQPGRLPLHAICGSSGSGLRRRALIPVVCSLSPQAASKRDQFSNLPIHIYFLNHHHNQLVQEGQIEPDNDNQQEEEDNPTIDINEDDPSMRAELSALIEAYPEGVFCGSQTGHQPIQHILSNHNLTQQERTIFRDTFHSLTDIQITSRLFLPYVAAESLGIPQARLLAQFLQRVQRLNFRPLGWPFTPEGWVQFFGSFTDLTALTHLEIDIPYSLLENHEECYQVVVDTLPQLAATLQSLIVSFPSSVPPLRRHARRHMDNNHDHVADMALPLAALIRQQQHNNNHLKKLIIRDGIDMDPTPILQSIAATHNNTLKTLDIRSVRNNCNVAPPLVDLLQQSRLESLAMRYIALEPRQVVFEALARNTHLKSIRLPGLVVPTTTSDEEELDDNPHRCLSLVLKHFNATLQDVHCMGASFQDVSGTEHNQIQYYALLNRHGRAKVRKETCSAREVLQLLQSVMEGVTESPRQAAILYGLLREAPVHWCSASSGS